MASMMEDIDGPDPKSSRNRICGTHLHEAIANGDFDAFQRLVKEGAPMEIKNCHGLTPLQVVCTKKDVEMVSALLRYQFSFLQAFLCLLISNLKKQSFCQGTYLSYVTCMNSKGWLP